MRTRTGKPIEPDPVSTGGGSVGKTRTQSGLLAIVSSIALASAPRAWAASPDDTQLSEIVVTATLRAAPAMEVPGSLTILGEQTLKDAARTNFEDVLGLIPNLNWAGDTSLPRYFQLRGIGELEQYQG